MNERASEEELGPAREPPQQRLQFPLRYLIYVTFLVAVACALLRNFLAIRGGWVIATVGVVYVFSLVAYFAIRIPILARRWRQGQERINRQRQAMGKWVASRRTLPTDTDGPLEETN